MNYSQIKYCDVANGIGVRTSVFVSGCNRHCKGCFNSEAWDFNAGKKLTWPVISDIMESLMPQYISGLSILGGEPLEHDNQFMVYMLCDLMRHEQPHKTIWLYTGYRWEQMDDLLQRPILKMIDVMVDGAFEEEQKDISLRFRGSRNQRIIDVPKSLKAGHVVLWEEKTYVRCDPR